MRKKKREKTNEDKIKELKILIIIKKVTKNIKWVDL